MNARLENLDKRVAILLWEKVRDAAGALAEWEEDCPVCRSIRPDFIRRTTGAESPSGLGLRQSGDRAYCPACDRCLLDES